MSIEKDKTLKILKLERDNCPFCNSNKYNEIYKGDRKHPKGRYFKKFKCIACGLEYIAESEREFNERVKDFIQDA